MTKKPSNNKNTQTPKPKARIASTYWLLLIVILIAFSFMLLPLLRSQRTEGIKIAKVYHNGKLIKSLVLDESDTSEHYRYQDEHGQFNEFEIKNGAVRIIEANCPDQYCVHQSWLNDTSKNLVCLPHKLVVKIEYTDLSQEADSKDANSKVGETGHNSSSDSNNTGSDNSNSESNNSELDVIVN